MGCCDDSPTSPRNYVVKNNSDGVTINRVRHPNGYKIMVLTKSVKLVGQSGKKYPLNRSKRFLCLDEDVQDFLDRGLAKLYESD